MYYQAAPRGLNDDTSWTDLSFIRKYEDEEEETSFDLPDKDPVDDTGTPLNEKPLR